MSKFYSKEKVIGSGTFGNVWLVKSKISNRYFVQKEVNLASMNATETQQALTEVTVLSRCRHRNIIKYKDAVIDHKKGILSIIMEYADGGDLYAAIVKQRSVPFKEYNVITWFTQICLALQYIHHKGILHRDLKTRNIFLTLERQVKVGDFGIARCLTETNELATTAIGTPYYLSPEICNRKPYNHKSDMWAVGCILFEMAALSHPFQACNLPHLLTLIVTGKRKELPRYCSLLVNNLVEKLLDENPETRPSADDILALPSLQPYLSKMWIIQNNSASVPKSFIQEENLRRFSVGDGVKNSNGTSPKRRASISSVDSRGIRTRFGFISKVKSTQTSKLATSSRSHSVKGYKNLPIRCAVKKEQFLTYRVLKPVTLKEKITNILCNSLKLPHAENDSAKRNVKSPESHGKSDCGYQSEEPMKYTCNSDKVHDFREESLTNSPMTSTKKRIDISNIHIEESIVDDVFASNTSARKPNPIFPINVNKYIQSGCPHSQCQQCILDMLWKNRIPGNIGPMVKTDGRLELIRKLEVVFGRDFFKTVYHVLISNWENSEDAGTPKELRDITSSLNYSQLQYLPLVMQLIQLDLVPK